MANSFKRKDYGEWDVFRKSYSRRELLTRRAQLAKVANSRLLRLERSTSHITGKALIENAANTNVRGYLESKNRRRFSEAKNQNALSDFQLRQEIILLEDYLKQKSSTVGGAREVEENRVQTFINDYNVPEEIARSSDFYNFLEGQTFEELSKESLDSEDIIDVIHRASDRGMNLDQIIKQFESHLKDKEGGTKKLYERFGLRYLQ